MLVEHNSQGKEDFQHFNHLGGCGQLATPEHEWGLSAWNSVRLGQAEPPIHSELNAHLYPIAFLSTPKV